MSSLAITNEDKEKRIKVYITTSNDFLDENEHQHGSSISDLEIDDHSAMSLTANLVRPPVGSAWQYAVDRANRTVGSFGCNSQAAVFIRCSSKNVSIDPTSQLQIVCRPEGSIKRATHVVVAVAYGLEAFCVFSAGDQEVEDFAHLFSDKLLAHDASGLDGPPQFQSILYSDLVDGRASQSIAEQFAACRNVLGHPSSKAIPLEVWLYPLNEFKEFKTNIRKIPGNPKDISPYLMVRCQMLWDRLQRVRVESDSLIRQFDTFKSSNIQDWNNLSAAYKRIQEFYNLVKEFIGIVLKAFTYWTVSIRRGEERNEERMVEMTEAIDHESPFDFNELIRWIDYHKLQVQTLETLTTLPGVNHLSGTHVLEDVVSRYFGSFIIVLHLPNLTGQPDGLVQEMGRYVNSFKANEQCSWTGMKRAAKPAVDYRPFLKAGQEFSDWVENYNSETENVIYIICYDKRAGQKPFLRLYHSGISESMTIPNAPGEVEIIENRRGVITLSWATEETDILSGYLFQYLDVNRPDGSWTSIQLELCQKEITIDYLQPEESYMFRVAAVTLAGMSPFGPISDEITIDSICSPPINIEIKLVTDSTITLAWDHEEWDLQERFKVTSYSVDCWVDGYEDSTLIRRITPNKEVTVEPLDRGTDYCIQIRAVCMDATGSTFYGPACPILDVGTERDAERLAQIICSKCEKSSPLSGIHVYCLPLTELAPGTDHYVFGQHSFSAEVGKCRKRTILMLGATGSGKTTLINAMVNYILDVKWEDDFRFKLVEEPAVKSQAHSQTDKITTYDLYHMKGSRLEYSLTVVDTPGFGDTQGIKRDYEILDQIQDYFEEHGIQKLEAVCFVVEASLPRLTKTQRYIFDKILSVFGNDIENNIRLMVTFADNETPSVLAAVKEAEIPSPKDLITGKPLHHKFNSSYFFVSNKEDANEINQTYFDMSVKSFDRFFRDLSCMETKSLARTTEVLDERKRLQVLVECFQKRTEMKSTRIDELEKIKKVLTDNEEEMEINQFFEFHVSKLVDISKTGQFTTNCNNCKMTCHFPCRQADDRDKNRCSVMGPDGYCRFCSCIWTNHLNQNYQYEMVKEKLLLDSIREQYQGTVNDTMTNKELLDRIQNDIDATRRYEKQLLEMKRATSEHIRRLDKIALRPHSVSTSYIDLMIETEIKKGYQPDSQEKIAGLKKLRTSAEFKESAVEQDKFPQEPQHLRQQVSVDRNDFTIEYTKKTKSSSTQEKDMSEELATSNANFAEFEKSIDEWKTSQRQHISVDESNLAIGDQGSHEGEVGGLFTPDTAALGAPKAPQGIFSRSLQNFWGCLGAPFTPGANPGRDGPVEDKAKNVDGPTSQDQDKLEKLHRKATQSIGARTSSAVSDERSQPMQQHDGRSDDDLANSLHRMTVTETKESKSRLLETRDPRWRKPLMKVLAEQAQIKSAQITKQTHQMPE